MAFVGADTGQLRELAKYMSRNSNKLTNEIIPMISGQLAGNPWRGPDRQQFERLWTKQLVSQLRAVASSLDEAAKTLRKNADDQDRTSESLDGPLSSSGSFSSQNGSAGGGGGGGGGGGWGDEIGPSDRHEADDSPMGYLKYENSSHKGEDVEFGIKYEESGRASVAHLEANVEDATLEADALFADVKGEGSISNKGLGVEASIDAGLARVEAEGKTTIGDVEISAKANAYAGTRAKAKARIDLEGAEVQTEAFVGGRVKGEAGVTVGGVGVKGKAEGWAGLGIEGGATFRVENGKLKTNAEIGVALGVGGKVGVGFEIDPMGVVNSAKNAVDAAVSFVSLLGRKGK